jgi:hypothetical protein
MHLKVLFIWMKTKRFVVKRPLGHPRLVKNRILNTISTLRNKYTEDIAIDGSLIQRELGFVPQYDLKTGCEETIREMRIC